MLYLILLLSHFSNIRFIRRPDFDLPGFIEGLVLVILKKTLKNGSVRASGFQEEKRSVLRLGSLC